MNSQPDIRPRSAHVDTSPDTRWRVNPRTARLTCIGISLLFFLKFAIFGLFITPLWDSPDEPGHYSYIVTLSHGHYPTLGKTPIEPEVAASWLGPKAKLRQNWIAQHPPLYYALAVPVELTARSLGLSLEGRVRAVRLVNAALGALTIFGLITFLTIGTKSLQLGLAGALLVGATPMFTQLSGATSNDVLTACTAAWGAYWYVRWIRANRFGYALACALFIGLGCITKITMLVLAIPLFFAMAWRLIRLAAPSRPVLSLKQIAVLWVTMFGLVAIWIAHNYLLFHALLPTARILRHHTGDLTHIGFFHFMNRFAIWQVIFWNFIALIGWMGTIGGKVITATADGLIVAYYASATLFASFVAILYPLRKLRTGNFEWAWLGFAAIAVAGSFILLSKIPFTTLTCAALFLAMTLSVLTNIKSIRSPTGHSWLVFGAGAFVLFFAFVYYYKIWGFYNQIEHVKGLHGRYFYPVLPWILLILLHPLRRSWLPFATMYAALGALMIGDGFFLHYAFEMYGKY